MDTWERDYDRWKTTPPDEVESVCKCAVCGKGLYVDEEYYDLDDGIYCEGCAQDWLEEHRSYVTEDMAYGNR